MEHHPVLTGCNTAAGDERRAAAGGRPVSGPASSSPAPPSLNRASWRRRLYNGSTNRKGLGVMLTTFIVVQCSALGCNGRGMVQTGLVKNIEISEYGKKTVTLHVKRTLSHSFGVL